MSGPPQHGMQSGQGAPAPVWRCFLEHVLKLLELRSTLKPMPPDEDPAHPTVRAMQRGRRHAWLHARYQLHWSMFESIRISVRLAEAFAEWTHDGAADVNALAGRLEQVEDEARQSASITQELKFVDQLMRAATGTDLHLAEMEMAMAAYHRVAGPPQGGIRRVV